MRPKITQTNRVRFETWVETHADLLDAMLAQVIREINNDYGTIKNRTKFARSFVYMAYQCSSSSYSASARDILRPLAVGQ
jgi:hypothetical protein